MILKKSNKKLIPINEFQSVEKRVSVSKLGTKGMKHPEHDVETVTYILPKNYK